MKAGKDLYRVKKSKICGEMLAGEQWYRLSHQNNFICFKLDRIGEKEKEMECLSQCQFIQQTYYKVQYFSYFKKFFKTLIVPNPFLTDETLGN